MDAVRNANCDHSMFAVVLPAIVDLERRTIEDEQREGKIEASLTQVSFARVSIDDGNVAGSRPVHENARTCSLELEGLGVACQLHRDQYLPSPGLIPSRN